MQVGKIAGESNTALCVQYVYINRVRCTVKALRSNTWARKAFKHLVDLGLQNWREIKQDRACCATRRVEFVTVRSPDLCTVLPLRSLAQWSRRTDARIDQETRFEFRDTRIPPHTVAEGEQNPTKTCGEFGPTAHRPAAPPTAQLHRPPPHCASPFPQGSPDYLCLCYKHAWLVLSRAGGALSMKCVQECQTFLWGGAGSPRMDDDGDCSCVCGDEWSAYNILGVPSCVPSEAHFIFGAVGLLTAIAILCQSAHQLNRQVCERILWLF